MQVNGTWTEAQRLDTRIGEQWTAAMYSNKTKCRGMSYPCECDMDVIRAPVNLVRVCQPPAYERVNRT